MRTAVNAEEKGERMAWLDAARGIAMLFILLGHAQVSIPGVSRFALLFYVPVFFVAAGYLYRTKEERFSAFVKRRARRLLLPYFGYQAFLLLFYYGKEMMTNGMPENLLRPLLGALYARNSLYPPGTADNVLFLSAWNSPLWFLPALFLSELIFAAICRLTGEKRRGMWLCMTFCLAAGALVQRSCPVLLPWSLDSILLFSVLLWCGYLMRRGAACGKCGKSRQLFLFFCVALVCALGNGEVNLSVGIWGKWLLFGVAGAGCAGAGVLLLCAELERCTAQKPWFITGLSLIGRSTMTILGLHLFVYMWLQGAAELLFPGVMAESGLPGELLRIGMAVVTLVFLTLLHLSFAGTRARSFKNPPDNRQK